MNWTALLESHTTWAIVSALAGMVAAVAAAFAVWQSTNARRAERESRRPYFIIEKPGIKALTTSPPFRVQITMENAGTHPASSFEGRLLFVEKPLDSDPTFDIQFSVANDIPANSPTPWYEDSLQLPQNQAPMYIVLQTKYRDELLGRDFDQIFYMKWHGVQDGKTHPDFVHVGKEERAAIATWLKGILEEGT